MPDIRVAWWNLENLFDASGAQRPEALKKRLKNELKGWTAAVRDRKISQLASIVRLMFGGAGPDLLGVCEIENETVAKLLANAIQIPGRDYRVMAHDSPDARGIDVSFLFDFNAVRISNTDHQVVVKRNATRDIFWADVTAHGQTFVAIANHWPSRRGGAYASEPYRMLTGETVSFVIEELFDAFDVGNELPVLVMGDFNDEPFNRSMQEYLLGSRDPGRVRGARNARLLNLMWTHMAGDDPGTYKFGSDWNMLDHFLISKGLLRQQSGVRLVSGSTEIFRPPLMVGSGGAPRLFGRPAKPKSFDRDGYSDHFPITVLLTTS